MLGDNLLNSEKLPVRHRFHRSIISLGELMGPAFNFGTINKNENPKEYFAAIVLNKLYSLNISTENCLLTNDVFLINYLYRYVYELYLKALYMFSADSDSEIFLRINNFLEGRNLKIKEYQEGIRDNLTIPRLKEIHKEQYRKMSEIAHPNIRSLNLHLHTDSNKQFDFLASTIRLILWHNIELVKLFSFLKLLDIETRLDRSRLNVLQNSLFNT